MTELLSTFDPENPKKSGIPTEKLVNAYRKWGLGGFGMLITGNIMVDPVGGFPRANLDFDFRNT